MGISEKRFHRERVKALQKAKSVVPRTARDMLALAVGVYGMIAGPLGCLFLIVGVIFMDVHLGLLEWLYIIASGLLAILLAGKLAAPRVAAVADVGNAFLKEGLKFAEAELLEYVRFYTTNDWRTLRAKVIRRDGKVCQGCGIVIKSERDITVDHIKPRSRFPDLALEISNLQVLCRSCNSSKGAYV